MKLKIFIIKLVELLLYFFYRFSIKKKIDYNKEFKKIALIMTNPLGIGDLIMSTPYIKTMRKNFPNSEIHLITDKDIFDVESVTELDYIHIVKGDLISLKNDFKLLSRENFDLGVIMNRGINQFLYLNYLKTKYKLGYMGGFSILANFKLEKTITFNKNSHFSMMSLNIAKALNLKIEKSLIKTVYSQKILDGVDRKLNSIRFDKNKPIIGLNTNVQWESRRWDEKNYIKIVKRLHKKFTFILLGGPGDDVKLNKFISNELKKNNIEIIDLSGIFSLKESIFFMSKLDYLITADSGPMHFALMMRTPTLGLFGPVNPIHRLPMTRNLSSALWYQDYKKVGSSYNYESEYIDKEMEGLKAIPVNDVEDTIVKFFKTKKLK